MHGFKINDSSNCRAEKISSIHQTSYTAGAFWESNFALLHIQLKHTVAKRSKL